jgi:GDSL-like Lipase/Acylhydrolase family
MPDLLPMYDKDHPNPHIPTRPVLLDRRLRHLRRCLDERVPVRIVAIGSSSTAGSHGVTPYPDRLEAKLRAWFPQNGIEVLNRGKSGEEARENLGRFDTDVLGNAPALVIWQVGTNAVFKYRDLKDVEDAIQEGLEKLSSQQMDVILMDPQYLPPLLTMDRADAARQMVSIFEKFASEMEVSVFRRFDYMRRMHRYEKVSFDTMTALHDENRLHHSDYSAGRVTQALFEVMVHAVRPPANA